MNMSMHKELEEKAKKGDAQAQIELAHIAEEEERGDLAVQWLRRAVEGGNVRAKALLAKRFLTRTPYVSDEGRALLFSAAEEGDAEAAHVAAVLHACGSGVERDWSIAFDYLTRAAELGFPLARKELCLLATGALEDDPESEPQPDIWKKLRDTIDLPAWISVPRTRVVSRDPRIMVVENAASPLICDWLIERAKPHLTAATVFGAANGELHQSDERDNTVVAFDAFKMDIILAILQVRISVLTGFSTGMEPINIFHYAVGQRYLPHFDFITATGSDAYRLTRGAQRAVTFLLYLNDDYEGGETHFPNISWQYKGRKGDAMFFWNVDAYGQPDRKTLHTGSAPTKGEKWILSQWILSYFDAA